MKLHYYPEIDSLYIEFRAYPSVESKEIAEGWVADYDEHGRVVGLDVQIASMQVDLSSIETVNLPRPVSA
jgi:uncharacterized protein YuzE